VAAATQAPIDSGGEAAAASAVLRRIAIHVGLAYTLVVLLEALSRGAAATVGAAAIAAVVIVLALRLWSPVWLGVVTAAGLITWWSTAVDPWEPIGADAAEVIEPARPLAIGIALTLLGLGLQRLSHALVVSMTVAAIALVGAAILGAPGPRILAGCLWSVNLIVVCALGGWGMRRGAALAGSAIAALAAARRDRVYGEEMARRRREHDIAVHDNVLATLTMLAHGGVGMDPAELRQRCREDLADFTAGRDSPLDVPTVGDLIDGWQRVAESLHLRWAVDVSTDGSQVLEQESRLALDGAVREALRNVRLHARTDAVAVRVGGDTSLLTVEVADDGDGFDPTHSPMPTRWGVARSIVRRIESVGGRAAVTSIAGEGTRVRIEIPDVVRALPGSAVPPPVPAAERLRRSSRTAPMVIGWVGVADATLLVSVFWQDYLVPGLAGLCLAVLLATGALTGRPTASRRRFRRIAALAAFVFLIVGATVTATLITPAGVRFTGANIGVTGVSLALVWLYRSQPSAVVLTLAGAHTTTLLCLALASGGGGVDGPWVLPALVARICAEALVVPVGVAVYLRSAGRAVVELQELDHEAARLESQRAAVAAADSLLADRRSRLRELAAPLLDDVASGRSPLPLDPIAVDSAVVVARGVRGLLSSGAESGWLTLALESRDLQRLRSPAQLDVLDGEGAAEDIPDRVRTVLLEVIGRLQTLAARRSASVAVVVTRYGDSVGVVLTAGPGVMLERDVALGGLVEAVGRLGGTSNESDGFVVVEVEWSR
jgi:signal transduction histidine kinase